MIATWFRLRPAHVAALVVLISASFSLLARQTTPPPPPATLAAGASHSLAIDAAGAVWAWGANIGGQVGDGSTTMRLAPVRLATLTGTFTAVAGGAAHSLALRSDGRVLAWGLNAAGEVGDGSTIRRTSPVLVSTLASIVQVAAGAQHSLALRSNGSVASWGANNEGQLGDNSTQNRSTPVTVSGLTNVVAIAAGGVHSMALKADGTVWTWGGNTSSQLGDNTTTRRWTPVRVTTLASARAIAAGGIHSVAVTQTGAVFAWGGNPTGQVGDGTTTTRRVPVAVSGLANIVGVSAGAAHTTAVNAAGALWAWGANLGALGDSTINVRTRPVAIASPLDARLVVAGGAHSLAVTGDGTVWSTGVNLLGPLGIGTTTSTTVFGPISGPGQVWGASAPVLAPAGGTFTVPQAVTATSATPGATLRYTVNGAEPSTTDPSVTSGGLIVVDQVTVLKVKAFKPGMTPSPVTTGSYTLQVAVPSITPGTGTYATPQTVTLGTLSPGAALFYTLDGTSPSAASTPYTTPFVVGAGATLKAVGVRAGWLDSPIGAASYSFNFGTLATPIATPGAGTYQTSQTVALTADAGAAIFFTVDGTDPTEASTPYAGPITIGATATLKARAFRTDYTASAVLTAAYVIDTTGGGEPLPPDPSTVAPPISEAEPTNFAAANAFLYSGPQPIQRGVAPGAITPSRFAVVRGRAVGRDGSPVSGVRITVLDHPELGHTLTRTDGMFDLALNGGGPVTLDYTHTGYLPGQRTVVAPWSDYSWAPDVILTPLDSRVTVLPLSPTSDALVAQGSPVTDQDGTRQATLIVPEGGVVADIHLPNGTILPGVSQLSIRATEYTVGPSGRAAMPGGLPTASGFTYAVELSADEALQVNATSVTFDRPLAFYVENFLGFPVGGAVPTGYYDRAKAQWMASANGRVVRIVSVTNAMADVDVSGDGAADIGGALTTLGVTDGERRQLATLYAVGQSLWRVPIPHLTPWDHNWPYIPPPDARDPDVTSVRLNDNVNDACTSGGSIIECETQVLGERLPVAGTPFSLNYRSNRVPGRSSAFTANVPLANASVPASLKRIDLEVLIAGQRVVQSFPPNAGSQTHFTWDGRDAYGRTVGGSHEARFTVKHVYDASYTEPAALPSSFGVPGGAVLVADRQRNEFSFDQTSGVDIQSALPPSMSVGGWSLSVHHFFDRLGKTVWFGDGERRQADAATYDVRPFSNMQQDNGTVLVGVAPDGSAIVNSSFAGLGRLSLDESAAFGINGIPAACQASRFGEALAIAHGAGEQMYYALADVRIGGDGLARTLCVGRVVPGPGLAGQADNLATMTLPVPQYLGRAFLAIDTTGVIHAASGRYVYRLAAGVAPALVYTAPANVTGLAVAADGTLYLSTSQFGLPGHIYRRTPSGQLTSIAGIDSGACDAPRVDGPFNPSSVICPQALAVDDDGNVVFVDLEATGSSLRRLSADGFATTLARPAQTVDRIAVAPTGEIYTSGNKVSRVGSALGGPPANVTRISSGDGSVVFEFAESGRHERTVDAVTGVPLYVFGYDPQGRLTSITDREGLVTTIERLPQGDPQAIVGPFGQRTLLQANGDGYLTTVQDPLGATTTLAYYPGALLRSLTTPRNHVYEFGYDATGRLVSDTDPAGGVQTLTRTELANGWSVRLESVPGRTRDQSVEELTPGRITRTTTLADGTASTQTALADGFEAVAPDGTRSRVVQAPDPRFGMQAPYVSSATVTTPAGRTMVTTTTRTVALANPLDPLSLRQSTDTTTVNGRSFTSAFDALTRRVTSISPEGRQTVTTLDTFGRPATMQVGDLTPIAFHYDALGRLDRRTQGGRQTTLAYDGRGYLQRATDPLTRDVVFTNDDLGRALSQQFPDGRLASFTYDSESNLKTLTPPGRFAHTLDYSEVNLLERYLPPTVPGAGETTYSYDTARRPRLVTRADGQTLTFGYQPGTGRPASITTPSGTLGYSYHPATGLLAGVTAPGASLAFAYDGALPLSETWSGGVAGAIAWTYDNDFRIASETVRGASGVSFSYDDDGLLMSAGSNTFTRFPATGLLQSSTAGSVATAFGYNGFGELISHTTTIAGAPAYNVTLRRDNGGRIDQQTEVLGPTTTVDDYGYDLAGRLETVRRNGTLVVAYGYDSNGNRNLVRTIAGDTIATFDAQDRIQTFGTRTYTHTPHGDVSGWTDSATGATTGLTYDLLGNLTLVQQPATTIGYVVDGRNRRIRKLVDGVPVQGFLWQGQLRPVAELDGSGALVSRFVYGTRINVPEYLVRGGVTYRIVTDHLGSVRLVVNTATNVVAQALTYDPWGVVVQDTNPGFQPFGYAGGLYDWQTGLVRFGVRDYDASIGRWLAKDPIAFQGGDTNLYRVNGSDPINAHDPTGLLSIPLLGWVDVGESAGQSALDYWASHIDDAGASASDRAMAWTGAALSALWTPCTSDATVATLSVAKSIGSYLGRPFWRYISKSSNPSGGWLTRGWGSKPPFGQDFAAAQDALQLPSTPTGVIPIRPAWYEPVIGPRVVSGNPNLGAGGGWEYFRGWWFPRN